MRDENKTKAQLIKELQSMRKKREEALWDSEERYRQLFTFAPVSIFLADADTLEILEWNEAALRLYGYDQDGNPQLKATDLSTEPQKTEAFIRAGRIGETAKVLRYNRKKDGTIFPGEFHVRFFSLHRRKKKLYYVAIIDLTERKRAEKAFEDKSRDLEEVNAALKVVLRHRENEKDELEEKIITNMKELVLPYVHKLKKSRLDDEQLTLMNIFEKNLEEILSPFLLKMKNKYPGLTRKEIQVANLIREGKTSKEIAQVLGVSKGAVDLHRYSIRRKLGLNNAKVNLVSFLSSPALVS